MNPNQCKRSRIFMFNAYNLISTSVSAILDLLGNKSNVSRQIQPEKKLLIQLSRDWLRLSVCQRFDLRARHGA